MKDMSSQRLKQLDLTRRTFLSGSAAAVGFAALPASALGQTPQAKYRRWEISDPGMPANVIPSYKKAVSAMLALEPTDARNWYRQAMVHLLDCPHGNWWFLPWHRAYLGWYEQICRELSEDPEFALPYWDWTKTPRVPAVMFEDVLDPNDPTSPGYSATFNDFRTKFDPVVSALYAGFTTEQNAQLANRGFVSSEADFWTSAEAIYSDQPNARGLTAATPDLDPFTQPTVSLATVQAALRVPAFSGTSPTAGFASAMATTHSDGSAQGILESQPHNNVHGAIGGLMGSFFSSVDPIFYLHHGNIDRLWDVWTRRQQALGRPTLPEGADLTTWSEEPFLFFSGPDGQPVAQTKAGDYAEIGMFDYDYSPGSGEDEVPSPAVAAATATTVAGARVEAEVSAAAADAAAGGIAEVPAGVLTAAEEAKGPPVVAEVTLRLDENDMGRRFRVLVTPEGAAEPVDAGTITIFGHQEPGQYTFVVPLPAGLEGAAAVGATAAASGILPLDIRVEEIEPVFGVGTHGGATAAADEGAPVTAIAVSVAG